MSPFDLAFIAIVALLGIRGVWRGFLVEWAGFVGLILGYWVAELYTGALSPHLINGLDLDVTPASYISFAIIMILVYILVVMVAKLITKMAKWVMLGWANRLLGAISGVAKGLIVSTLAIAVCTILHHNGLLAWWEPETISSSPYLRWPSAWAAELLQFWSADDALDVITA